MNVRPNLYHGETATLRRHAMQILGAGVAAADPAAAIRRAVKFGGSTLRVNGWEHAMATRGRIIVCGAGKAAARMGMAVEHLLGDCLDGGVLVTRYGYGAPLRRIELVEAGHPLPDAAGQRGAERVAQAAAGAGADDLVLVLISGGGSALLPLPAEGITLEEKVAATDLLLRSGATIGEVNAVRKHLSRIKGGQLARLAAPATLVTLILSDVLGNPLDAIASGPTVPDPTTFADALAIADRYGLRAAMPAAVRARLEAGAAGRLPETPKPGDPAFERAQAVVVGDITLAAGAAVERAEALGYRTRLLETNVQGPARDVGARLGNKVHEAYASRPQPHPVCLVMGGETTVTVRGHGRGGRNQEVALGAAAALAGLAQTLVAAFGTDGVDGPTDAAGGVVDGTTLARARERGLDLEAALDDNDAYPFLEALEDLIVTGPTHTNVNDLWLGLIGPAHARAHTAATARGARG
jgi:hydroxypyruvate reductase